MSEKKVRTPSRVTLAARAFRKLEDLKDQIRKAAATWALAEQKHIAKGRELEKELAEARAELAAHTGQKDGEA